MLQRSTFLFVTLLACSVVCAEEEPAAAKFAGKSDAKPTYLLEHSFTKGDNVRTKVTHQVAIKTTVKGTTQAAKTLSISTKAWRITHVDEKGNVTLIQSVESVDMRQQIGDGAEVRYNSLTDKKTPEGFQDVAKALGRPLVRVTITPRGEITDRVEHFPQPNSQKGQLVALLPKGRISIGHVWTLPETIPLRLKSGVTKKIKTRERYELEKVEDGIAVIEVQTQVLTPIHSPEIEVQVIQRTTKGTIHFDIAKGRVIKKVVDLNRRVVDFSGPGSLMHYMAKFSEQPQAPSATPVANKPEKPAAEIGSKKGPPKLKR